MSWHHYNNRFVSGGDGDRQADIKSDFLSWLCVRFRERKMNEWESSTGKHRRVQVAQQYQFHVDMSCCLIPVIPCKITSFPLFLYISFSSFLFFSLSPFLLDYDPIFQHLDTIQGTADTKRAFVQEVIKEAERFRKKQLVALLYDWTLGLPKGSGSSNNSRIKPSTAGR